MSFTLTDAGPEAIDQVASVPARFEVREVARTDRRGRLRVTAVRPWWKDYDDDPDEGPSTWATRFDVAAWRLALAHDGGKLVGVATLAVFSPPLVLFDDVADGFVLWDLRVDPAARRGGVGGALVDHLVTAAFARGADRVAVETQDVNVPALRLYLSRGFTVRAWLPEAYETLDETCVLLQRTNERRERGGNPRGAPWAPLITAVVTVGARISLRPASLAVRIAELAVRIGIPDPTRHHRSHG